MRDPLRHPKPHPIPPYYCVFTLRCVIKIQLPRCHHVNITSSFIFCEKDSGMGLLTPYHTSLAIRFPLKHQKPQPVPPNYCGFPFSFFWEPEGLSYSHRCVKWPLRTQTRVLFTKKMIKIMLFWLKDTLLCHTAWTKEKCNSLVVWVVVLGVWVGPLWP